MTVWRERTREQSGFIEIVGAAGGDEAGPMLDFGLPGVRLIGEFERPHGGESTGGLFGSLERQIAFAIRAGSGQAGSVAVTQNRDPMTVAGQIKKGADFDSVTLMRVGKQLAALPDVADAAVVKGTESNQAILAASGLLISQFKRAGARKK